MALDDLKETIETLRERIQAHRPYLAGYETRTRQALIDPMLRALGWDVEDPNAVELEYGINRQNRVDYVLMGNEGRIAMIEAKSLERSLDDNVIDQVLKYAHKAVIPYIVVSNGDHWQMSEVFRQATPKDRILMEFQLTKDEPYACALQALALWRSNLASGKPQAAATPIMPTPEPMPEPSSRQPSAEPAQSGAWTPLASLQVTKGQQPPTSIQFPNASPKPLRSWVDLWVSVAEHLVETDKISKGDCPVKWDRSISQYFLHTQPIHSTGREFERERQIGDLWVECSFHRNFPKEATERSRWLLEKFGVNPATVHVASGKPQAAATPVMPAPEEPMPEPSSRQPSAEPAQSGAWTPLASLQVTKGQQPPTSIQFPNASQKPLRFWVDLWASVAEHLVETGKISKGDCPVKWDRSISQYFLHTQPIHSTGREFESKRQIGNLWVECSLHKNSPKEATERSCWLLEKFGVDPATVHVASGKPQAAATPVTPAPEESSSRPPAQSDAWTPLTSLQVTKGQQPPTSIQFPNASQKPLRSWVDLWESVANHLVETGKISKGDCPVKWDRSISQYFLHTQPIHSTGREFESKRQIGDLWVECSFHRNFPKEATERSCWLLEKFGVNPATVRVSTNQS